MGAQILGTMSPGYLYGGT